MASTVAKFVAASVLLTLIIGIESSFSFETSDAKQPPVDAAQLAAIEQQPKSAAPAGAKSADKQTATADDACDDLAIGHDESSSAAVVGAMLEGLKAKLPKPREQQTGEPQALLIAINADMAALEKKIADWRRMFDGTLQAPAASGAQAARKADAAVVEVTCEPGNAGDDESKSEAEAEEKAEEKSDSESKKSEKAAGEPRKKLKSKKAGDKGAQPKTAETSAETQPEGGERKALKETAKRTKREASKSPAPRAARKEGARRGGKAEGTKSKQKSNKSKKTKSNKKRESGQQ